MMLPPAWMEARDLPPHDRRKTRSAQQRGKRAKAIAKRRRARKARR